MSRPADFKRTTLRPQDRPIVRAIAEAFYSPDGECSDERLDAFVEDVDGFVSPTSKTLRFGLLLLLIALRWSPLFYGKFRPFEALSLEERLSHMDKLEKSKHFALLVVSYKTILTMIFYEDEGELRGLGYPGAERHRYKRGLPIAAQPTEAAE